MIFGHLCCSNGCFAVFGWFSGFLGTFCGLGCLDFWCLGFWGFGFWFWGVVCEL